jgi:hypothetical protein
MNYKPINFQQKFGLFDERWQLIGVNPAFDELRGDPRFQEIVGRLGLPSMTSG